jgi:hypothetical protein
VSASFWSAAFPSPSPSPHNINTPYRYSTVHRVHPVRSAQDALCSVTLLTTGLGIPRILQAASGSSGERFIPPASEGHHVVAWRPAGARDLRRSEVRRVEDHRHPPSTIHHPPSCRLHSLSLVDQQSPAPKESPKPS